MTDPTLATGRGLVAAALLLVAVVFSGCGSDDVQTHYARGHCINNCIDRHLDEMTHSDDADVDADTYQAVANVCRDLFACVPCAGNTYTRGDFGTCETPGTLKAPKAVKP